MLPFTSPPHPLPWIDPLALAARVQDADFMLLYSGVQASYSGRYSFLCTHPAKQHESNHFADFASVFNTSNALPWFGYLSYELAHDLEQFPVTTSSWITLPLLSMHQYQTVYCFDHSNHQLTRYGPAHNVEHTETHTLPSIPTIIKLQSNMTRDEYLQKVHTILQAIHNGTLYQANLTRKFYGTFESAPDSFALFNALSTISPAPYSAYIKRGDRAIISSSPERFLHINDARVITTRPIKGSIARGTDSAADEHNKTTLANSSKDRAENLMIVDLMRNDLSRSCIPGSVNVDALYEVTTHAHIHHMSSTISGKLKLEINSLQAIQHCFPPGSMTGAPKRKAMELCAELETIDRGIYSGAIGWLDANTGTADLSVVIRTLVVQDNKFEFQVGGGIVADSIPEQEWQETIVKARGIAATLGIPIAQLEAL